MGFQSVASMPSWTCFHNNFSKVQAWDCQGEQHVVGKTKGMYTSGKYILLQKLPMAVNYSHYRKIRQTTIAYWGRS